MEVHVKVQIKRQVGVHEGLTHASVVVLVVMMMMVCVGLSLLPGGRAHSF